MNIDAKEVTINGVVYVVKGTESKQAKNTSGMPYVVVRTINAGVHAGYLKKKEGTEVVLVNSRRLWYWSGAATLSQLAMEGVKNQKECKFTMEVDEICINGVIEIINTTEESKNSITGVKIWKV